MIQDNFHIPSIYGYIIIVAVAIGGLLMTMPPNKPQKVAAVQAPDISIYDAANDGNIEAVKQHLADGADVNAKNDFGSTPLIAAALKGHKEIAELLISEGADVNAKNDRGQTPLDWAEVEIADLLRKHGAKTGEELKAEGK